MKTVGFLLKCMYFHDGVGSHCETLIRGLNATGWKVVIISGPVFFDSKSKHRFEAINEMVKDWIVLEDFRPMRPSLRLIFHVRKIVKQYRISLFHAHGYATLIFALIMRMLTGVRCVATFHPSIGISDPKKAREEREVKDRKVGWHNLRYRVLLELTAPSALIAYSSEIQEWLLQDLRITRDRAHKIVLGVNTEYFRLPSNEERAEARKSLGLDEKELVCALVGRMSWDKGHDILIEAVRRVRDKESKIPIRCLLVGSGASAYGGAKEEIKAYAHTNAIDLQTFLFPGHVIDLRQIYWSTDIFILPSRVEGFALVVAEAMCCGAVPIRTPSGGACDQIQEGKTGYIIPFDDVEALVAVILRLTDPELRRKIAHQSEAHARASFDAQHMVQKTIALYDRFRI